MYNPTGLSGAGTRSKAKITFAHESFESLALGKLENTTLSHNGDFGPYAWVLTPGAYTLDGYDAFEEYTDQTPLSGGQGLEEAWAVGPCFTKIVAYDAFESYVDGGPLDGGFGFVTEWVVR